MFDDQMPAQGGQTPPNLPVGEPEDMFADVDPAPPEAPPAAVAQTAADPAVATAMPAADTRESEVSADLQPPAQAPQPPQPIVESQVATPAIPTTTAIEAGMLQPVGQTSPSTSIPPGEVASQVIPGPGTGAPTTPAAAPAISSMPPEFSAQESFDDSVREPSFARKIMMVFVIFVVSLGVGFLLWFVYSRFFMASPEVEVDTFMPAIEDTEDADTDAFVPPTEDGFVEPIVTNTVDMVATTTNEISTSSSEDETTAEDQILFGDTIDTDEDLLDDDQELQFNTDPRNWDTDGDGLSDGEEVLNWGTDPLSPDTDGDGFEDKAEIDAGYSPTLGGGARLFDTAPATSTDS